MNALKTVALMLIIACSCLFHSSGAVCSDPGRPQFGHRIGDSFADDAQVRYFCRSGYTLNGSRTSRCGCSNGICNWNPIRPSCIRVCPNPVRINNGEVVGTKFDAGRSIEYRCDDGYRISGSAYSVCRCFGSSCRWVPPSASCVPLECPAPGNVTNGTVKGTVFRDDHWIVFHCLPGYQLNGSSHSVCRCSNNSCSWSSPLPTCVELACSDPGMPEHGSREGLVNFTDGARVRYKCDAGYHLLGSSQSTCYCLPHKCQWLPARPICTRGCVKPPPIPYCKTTGGDCKPGGSLQFRCYDGYWLEGSRSVSCICNGGECRWDSIIPHCVELECGRPRKPKNGYRRGRNFGVGDRVSFDCRFGYDLQGSHESVCRCHGKSCQWDPPIDQTCVPVQATCSAPKSLANGRIKANQYGLGRTVQYICNKDYRMEGEASSVCKCLSTNGCHWVPQPPRCIHSTVTTCETPKLNHGHIIGSRTAIYEAHQHVRFSCDPGYKLSNSSDSVCRCKKSSCNWSPSLPTCTKVCSDPFPVVNGHVKKTGRNTGDTAVYECYYGFRLRGNGHRTCRSDGTWDGRRPVCSRV